MSEDTYADFDFDAFQQGVIAEFRANNGKVGGMFEGWALVLLTTIGAKSGLHRTNPLGYLEIDGQALVVASAMGASTNPAWYHNIRKNPMVTVETGTETYAAIAEIPAGAERDALFAKVVALDPGFGEYQAKTTRLLPVVTLHRIASVQGADRVRGLGDFLVESHDWLREQLAELRRQVDLIVDGDAATIEPAAPDLARQMRTHCLTFCGALSEHHQGEEMGAFPMLARQYPALTRELAKLAAEHEIVARLQGEIQRIIDSYVPGDSDPRRLRAELAKLTSELEAHFTHEERAVVTALNAMGPAPEFG